MNLDVARIAEQINGFWDDYGYTVILATGAVALALVLFGLVKVARSQQRDRLVSGLTAVVVLAWTSEGLWEVARYTLGLPIAFAVMTFFVFEAMMVSSAMQAERHRRRHGVPGPAGRYVWVLACLTATVVALNAATPVEAVLRFALPLAATGLWWVGITADRDSDDQPDEYGRTVREKREQAARDRAATWAVTPRTVLVRLGLMRPGAQTVTGAEREYRVRRMVVYADRVHTARPGGLAAQYAAYRLRRLARQASAEDVTAVRERVDRTTGILALVLPGGSRDPDPGTPELAPARPTDDAGSGPEEPHRPPEAPGHEEAGTTRAGSDDPGTRAVSDPAGNGHARVPTGHDSAPGQDHSVTGRPGTVRAITRQAAGTRAAVGRSHPGNPERAQAERAYRESVAAGEPLSGGQLAARFGCDESTARRWIRSWRTTDPTLNGHQQAEVNQ